MIAAGLLRFPRFAFSRDASRFLELAPGWWIQVPGLPSFHHDDAGTVVIWDDRWTIRATPVTTSGAIPAEEMLQPVEGVVEQMNDGVLLNLGLERVEVIDGRRVRTVPTQAAAPGSLMLLFFHGHGPDLQERAHTTARTLRHIPLPSSDAAARLRGAA